MTEYGAFLLSKDRDVTGVVVRDLCELESYYKAKSSLRAVLNRYSYATGSILAVCLALREFRVDLSSDMMKPSEGHGLFYNFWGRFTGEIPAIHNVPDCVSLNDKPDISFEKTYSWCKRDPERMKFFFAIAVKALESC